MRVDVAKLVINRHFRSPIVRKRLAAQELLRGLLLGLVVVGVTDQPVPHPMQHVHDVGERLIHLTHGVVRGQLGLPTPAGTGDILRGRPHLASLIRNGLGVHLKTARHRPHLMRISHKTRRHFIP
jgi:hypothetical protein